MIAEDDGTHTPGTPGDTGASGEGASSGGEGGATGGAHTGGSVTGGSGGRATGGRPGETGGSGNSGGGIAPGALDPGTEVELDSPHADELSRRRAELAALEDLDAEELMTRYPTELTSSLGYDALAAAGLDLVQASALELDEAEREILGQHGFVVTERKTFPSFVSGYASIYGEHLPVYVSADSVLNAVHRSYDTILETIEEDALSPMLAELLQSMLDGLATRARATPGDPVDADADLYLTVAKGLLDGAPAGAVVKANDPEARELYDLALAHQGIELDRPFLGVERDFDFSQFEPRGHYRNSPELERYFRAMTWLGLVDLRLIESLPNDGVRVFRRRQLELAYRLRDLMNASALGNWSRLESAILGFVGESDNMTPPELDDLLADLGVGSADALSSLGDEAIAQAIVDGDYGTQRISGHLVENGTDVPFPLSSTFLLFGKRYVPDSHVLSSVVYSRVPERSGRRMMPNPLDAAFGALANNQAAALLSDELENYSYAPELAGIRLLIDQHAPEFWEKNLYNGWLSALRALSPSVDGAAPSAVGMPSVTGTEAWGRRILNTQLASWAELRHDTLLYAKQSYTDVPACEFPDAYVEPYPEFFAAIARLATKGRALMTELDLPIADAFGANVNDYFDELETTATRLSSMAEKQRNGTAYSADDLAFVNGLVTASESCFFDPNGWYPRLVFGHSSMRDTEFDPVVADVHTQPADAGGNIVGHVLHVGTGAPRLMVVTVDTCSGPRAYVGLASSYFERITSNFERLTDQDWSAELMGTTPPDVPWMQDLVARVQ